MQASLSKKYINVAVRKTKKGLALKRWFKEKWTVKTWGEMSPSEKKRAVAEKKRVGMGRKTSQIRRKSTKRKKRK